MKKPLQQAVEFDWTSGLASVTRRVASKTAILSCHNSAFSGDLVLSGLLCYALLSLFGQH